MNSRIPVERVAVLIGKNGSVKRDIIKRTGVVIDVDSKTGDVNINGDKAEDPSMVLKVMDFIMAVGNGFSPERASSLFGEDCYIEVFDIRDYVGKEQSHVSRMRARIIGTKGKTRQLIEELAGVAVSILGNYITLIGDMESIETARVAVDMLLNGSEHRSVYGYLEKRRRELKMAGLISSVEFRED